MAHAWRYGATAAFMTLVVVAGILHGQRTFRWTAKPPLTAYIERLKDVPMTFDGWLGEDMPRFTDDLRTHGIEDYLYRNYRSRTTTESYRVLIVVGRPGPISSHTPDVCYRGSGYTSAADPARADVAGVDSTGSKDGRNFQLFSMKFKPPITRATDSFEKEIRWSWLAPSKQFQAADSPRTTFPNEPALYKIYIDHDRPATSLAPVPASTASPLPAVAATAGHDPTKFLQALLPRVETALKDPAPKPQ